VIKKRQVNLVLLTLMVAGLLFAINSVEIGTRASFVDTEAATVSVVAASNWEQISLVGTEGDGQWNSPTWQVSLYAGERKETAITFGNSYVEDIAVTLSVFAKSADGNNLVFGLDSPEIVVPAQGEVTVVLWVEATQSVTPGIYSASIILER
jgi:hypothetical protein